MPALPSGNLPAVRPGARPYQGWAFYRATDIACPGHGACASWAYASRSVLYAEGVWGDGVVEQWIEGVGLIKWLKGSPCLRDLCARFWQGTEFTT